MVSKDVILGALPPFKDEWILLHPDQSVKDIIKEVLNNHDEFSADYDKICLFFDDDDTEKICENLYEFCKNNLPYVEEKEDEQTVASPGAMLTRGHCDCKGYANFIGGNLAALSRLGDPIKWSYRFASYDATNSAPHHVFIVVQDKGDEIWVDPTPGSEVKQPIWQVDKKLNSRMPLYKISGLEKDDSYIGITSINVTPVVNGIAQLNFSGTGKESQVLAGMWPHYLGLSDYRDYSGDRSINEWSVASVLNQMIAADGGNHTVTGDFVKWVYDNSIRSWNFFYPGGVDPDYDGADWASKYRQGFNTPTAPDWIITPDGRLALSNDVRLDDYRNAYIQIMTAWAQNLINTYGKAPYPVKPQAVKEFSQNYTGNPGNINANFFNEDRGSSIFSDIGHAFESAINWVKDIGVKVIGIVPRNAFLSLVGLNVFHMATHLMESINAGHWDEISHTWEKLGGDPDKLKNTIEHGSQQQPIQSVSQPVEATIGAVPVAALIAAAGPIIVALLKFLNKDGKLDPFIQTAESKLTELYPEADWSILDGALSSSGTPVDYYVDPTDNENSPLYKPPSTTSGFDLMKILPFVLIIGGAALFLMEKRKTRKKVTGRKPPGWLVPVGLGAALVLIMKKQSPATQPTTTTTETTTALNPVDQVLSLPSPTETTTIDTAPAMSSTDVSFGDAYDVSSTGEEATFAV